MRPDVADDVARACGRAGAHALRTALGEPGDGSLLVAHLPIGTRRIPDDVLEVLANQTPQTPLLLLCDEPLALPTTTLHHGRVTLLEQPCSAERLYSSVRMLLNAAPNAPSDFTQRTCARFWSADIGGVASEIVPEGDSGDEDGVLCVIPLANGFSAAEKLPELRDVFDSTRESADRSRALTALLGARGGVIYLSPGAQAWTLYWPPRAGALWFFSHSRLPRASELSRVSDAAALFRFGASSGDVAIGLAAPLSLGSTRGRSVTLDPMTLLAGGGPALRDHVARAAGGAHAFIAEVR